MCASLDRTKLTVDPVASLLSTIEDVILEGRRTVERRDRGTSKNGRGSCRAISNGKNKVATGMNDAFEVSSALRWASDRDLSQ
ncbi:hypothetical protein RRF57_000360 [Xylaria bambusicola]|uniref:Uncharacterized protein n=1 Tax=Xylaria bambusicola TaxID=326684 RepID=A0AAN7U3G2_9PEZI